MTDEDEAVFMRYGEVPTICEDCDNVHGSTRAQEPFRWRCIRFPVLSGYKFVSRTFSPHPPYARCEDVNKHGACPHWTPLKQPQPQPQGSSSWTASTTSSPANISPAPTSTAAK